MAVLAATRLEYEREGEATFRDSNQEIRGLAMPSADHGAKQPIESRPRQAPAMPHACKT